MHRLRLIFCFIALIFAGEVFAQQSLSTLHSFNWGYSGPYGDGSSPGSFSMWGLNDPIEFNGRIYGMTMYGGQYTASGGDGVIYSCLPDGSDYVIIHTFDNETDGYRPFGGLTAANGFLYGMTYNGGSNSSARGCIFRIAPYNGVPYNSAYTILHNFTYPNDVYYPHSSLLLHDNKLWGIGTGGPGGSPSYGGIFYYDLATSTYTLAATFTQASGGPSHSDITLYNGRLYFVTDVYAALNGGSVLSIDPSAAGFDLVKHADIPANTNPLGRIAVLDNHLYFASYNGGSSASGAIWKFNPANNQLNILLNLPTAEGGASNPCGGLMAYRNKLWIATHYGTPGCGGLISFNADGSGYQQHQSFGCGGLGLPAHPVGNLMNYNNYIYGVTSYGGANNNGSVYRYGPFIANAEVATHSWEDLTNVSFLGKGEITNTGGENCTRRGFCYSSTEANPTINDQIVFEDGSFGIGNFQLTVSGLFPSTIYHYRAYAVNSQGVSYGDPMTLTTFNQTAIEVSTLEPDSIKYNAIYARGNIINLNGLQATQRGFCYSQSNPEPNIYDGTIFESGDFTTGEFSLSIENLQANSSYYVRAYTASGNSVYYAPVVSISTPIEPLRAVTNYAYHPNFSSLEFSYSVPSDGGSPVTQRGIIYSKQNSGLTIDLQTKTNDGIGTGYFNSRVNNIESNVLYYYRAYAVNANGVAYGEIREITIQEPCLYVKLGMENLFNGTVHKQTSVTVEFRTGTTISTSQLAYRTAGIVDNTGKVKINYQYNSIESGTYWIIVRASGYLSIASKTALAIDIANNTTINFLDNQASTYQTSMTKLKYGKYLMKVGDINSDRSINGNDGLIIKVNSGNSSTLIPGL